MTRKEINERIFKMAKAKGINTRPLAAMAGMSYTILNRMQKQPNSTIDLIDAIKICRVLDVSLTQLITGDITPYETGLKKISNTATDLNYQVKELTVLV